MPGDFVQRQPPHATRRVVDHRLAPTNRREHHEMVEIPVQHTRRLKLREVLHLRAQRARIELHQPGQPHQVHHGGALQRKLKALAKGGQIGVQPMVGGHHGQAGQPTFRGLGLQHHRHASSAKAELQCREQSTHDSRRPALNAAREAQQRLEDPFDQPAPVKHDVGLKLHACHQGLGLAVGLHGLLFQRHRDAIQRLSRRRAFD